MVNTAAFSPFSAFTPFLYNYSFLPFFSVMWIWFKKKRKKKKQSIRRGRKLLSEFQEEKLDGNLKCYLKSSVKATHTSSLCLTFPA